MTGSYLYAREKYNTGDNSCYYCGIKCGNEYITKEYVKKTFTNRDIVRNPGSKFVCGCCVESMIGKGTTTQIDGTVKTGVAGGARMYSWLLTEFEKKAFTKRHMEFARNICLNPPNCPFSIILADSGQKQLIFRAPVNYDNENYKLLLEDNEIVVNTKILKEYLKKAVIVSKYIGKVQLKTPDQFQNYRIVIEDHGNEQPLVEWIKIYTSPMGQLASWLAPNKEECRNGIIIS